VSYTITVIRFSVDDIVVDGCNICEAVGSATDKYTGREDEEGGKSQLFGIDDDGVLLRLSFEREVVVEGDAADVGALVSREAEVRRGGSSLPADFEGKSSFPADLLIPLDDDVVVVDACNACEDNESKDAAGAANVEAADGFFTGGGAMLCNCACTLPINRNYPPQQLSVLSSMKQHYD
jgi:hypothetical protein